MSTTIAGVKVTDMSNPRESAALGSVGRISPDPYSHDHRIALDQVALGKLGVAGIPKVGDVFHVIGQGHVDSVSSSTDEKGNPNLRVGMQLKKMAVKKAPKGDANPFEAASRGVKEAEAET